MPACLEEGYLKPLGAGSSKWLQTGVRLSATATPQISVHSTGTPGRGHHRGGAEALSEGSHPGSTDPQGGGVLHIIPGAQERRHNAACDQSTAPQLFPSLSTLQDRGYPCGEGPPSARGLDDMNRSERCLFFHPQDRKFQRFVWQRKSYQFTCLPLFWSGCRPQGLHKGAKASDSSHEEQRGAL